MARHVSFLIVPSRTPKALRPVGLCDTPLPWLVFQAITDNNDFQFTLQLTYVRLYNMTLQRKYSSILAWSDFLGWLPTWLMKVIGPSLRVQSVRTSVQMTIQFPVVKGLQGTEQSGSDKSHLSLICHFTFLLLSTVSLRFSSNWTLHSVNTMTEKFRRSTVQTQFSDQFSSQFFIFLISIVYKLDMPTGSWC